MRNLNFKTPIILVVVFFILSVQSHATDGYFNIGFGTINKGLAGAGIAYYQGSLINGNPAGGVFLGNKYELSVDFFNANRQYTVAGNPSGIQGTFGLMPGTVESDSKLFLMPSAGANWMLGEKSSLSVSVFANGGGNTNYPTATFYDQSSEKTGVNLAQMLSNITFSQKLGDNHSLGVSGVIGYQSFKAYGLASFASFSSNSTALTGNGNDKSFGFGFKVGYLGYLTDNLSIGATYQSKVKMGAFDKYAGLFAQEGDFDVPASWTAGAAWNFVSDFTLMADVKQILYSGVKSVSNPMFPNLMTNDLGTEEGAGFGWKDIMVYKIGLTYSGIETWTFRGGVSIGENPIQESEVMFNILVPAIVKNQLALGFSKEIGNSGSQFNLAIKHALNNSIKGPNPLDPEGPNPLDPQSGQTIELEMNQFELELGFSF